jgi:hypothetical protein
MSAVRPNVGNRYLEIIARQFPHKSLNLVAIRGTTVKKLGEKVNV